MIESVKLHKSTSETTSTNSADRATLNNATTTVTSGTLRTQTVESEMSHWMHTILKTKSTAVQTDTTVTDNTKSTTEMFTDNHTTACTRTDSNRDRAGIR